MSNPKTDSKNSQDQERVTKACQTANLLVQDLREMLHSDNALLADVTMEILEQAVKVENRLKRVEAIIPAK